MRRTVCIDLQRHSGGSPSPGGRAAWVSIAFRCGLGWTFSTSTSSRKPNSAVFKPRRILLASSERSSDWRIPGGWGKVPTSLSPAIDVTGSNPITYSSRGNRFRSHPRADPCAHEPQVGVVGIGADRTPHGLSRAVGHAAYCSCSDLPRPLSATVLRHLRVPLRRPCVRARRDLAGARRFAVVCSASMRVPRL